MIRGSALLPVAFLAACSGEPTPQPTPIVTATPAPAPTPAPSPRVLAPGQLPSPELDGAAPMAGRWQWDGASARFAVDGRIAFALRCDRAARHILVSRTVGQGGSLRLFTDSAGATYPAQVVDGAVETQVATGETFLNALAKADAIGIAVDDGPVVRVPGDRAIGAVVRGCRPAAR